MKSSSTNTEPEISPADCHRGSWKDSLTDIFWGDDRPSQTAFGRSCLVAEDGMISIITLISVLFFLVLVGFLGNIGLVINQKIEVQNGADSIALAASQVQARAMNAVTASNHIMGELMALVIIHHAFGGDELDNGESKDSPDDASTSKEVELAYEIQSVIGAGAVPPISNASTIKSDVNETPKAGATLFDSVIRLRRVLAWSFYAYGFGGALQQLKPIPIVGQILFAAGVIISGAAMVYIEKVYLERKILKGLEFLAKATSTAKQAIVQLVRGLYIYQVSVVTLAPAGVIQSTSEVGEQSLVSGNTYPGILPPAFLPVEAEPDDLPPNQTQLARATWPWVNRWRVPIQNLMWQWLRLARSANYYEYYSLNFTWEWVEGMKKDYGVNLHVMKGLYGEDGVNGEKGSETWTRADGSKKADDLFCLIGLAHRDAPRLASSGIFKPQNTNGVVAYAQAMVYNGNPQHGPGGGGWQARIGWDTLNWTSVVPELPDAAEEVDPKAYHGLEWYEDGIPVPEKPTMFLNWRTKLVPETRLREAALVPGPSAKVIYKMIPVPRSFKTH